MALRKQLAADGISVSYNDLFLTILAKALAEHPRLNASLVGDTIQVRPQIDLGVAVDTERGLMVPVVREVESERAGTVGSRYSPILVERARSGRCTPDELTGGTFTLTNLGMYGIDAFTPIINLPECALTSAPAASSRSRSGWSITSNPGSASGSVSPSTIGWWTAARPPASCNAWHSWWKSRIC